MVETDRLVRERLCQRNDVGQLRLEHPSIEGEPHLPEMGEAFTESRVEIESFRCMEGRTQHLGIGIPGALVTNALEPSRCGSLERFQHFGSPIAQLKIGVADDRCAGAQVAIKAAGSLCRDAIDEFDLADGLFRIAIGSIVERTALHEDRADHVVAAGHVRMKLVEGVIGVVGKGRDERM